MPRIGGHPITENELSHTCFMKGGGTQLELGAVPLPEFLVQAFKLAGTGHLEQAEQILTPCNIGEIDRLITQGLPGHLTASLVMGVIFQQLRRWDEAIRYLKAGTAKEPNAAAFNLLANACHYAGRMTDALAARRRVLELVPDNVVIQGALARDLFALRQLDEGLSRMEALLEAGTMTPTEHSNYLLYLHYKPDIDQDTLLQAHQRWGQQHCPVSRARRHHDNPVDPERRLRIGYISADFHDHAAAYAIEAILQHRNPDLGEIYGYGNVGNTDHVTERLAGLMDCYRSIVGVADEDVAAQIEADRIDILVALSGHTGGHRLQVLGYKPAPIQVDWGWINSTGITQIDYRFTDSWFNPPGSERHYGEKQLRLPGGMSIFRPIPNAPHVTSLPALENGYVTFGSSNNHLKLNDPILKLWVQVLAICPDSRMIIKCQAGDDAASRRHIEQVFTGNGITPNRISIIGWQDQADYLRFYQGIDITLDTHPFNGCITTFESLWMGVPVVSLVGGPWVSRMGLSLLANMGFEKFAAHTPEQFIARAQALAASPEHLAHMRGQLRTYLQHSPVCDGKRLAGDIERAYRLIWRDWCSTRKAEPSMEQEGML